MLNRLRRGRDRAACLVLAAVVVTLGALGLGGCREKKEETKPDEATAARVREAPTAPTAPPTEKGTTRYAIDAKGKASIDMPAPKEHIKAETSATAGWIDVDPTKLASARGEVRVDLATLTTHTFDDTGKNESQTEHARTWLEVVVNGTTHEENRWAVFTIESIEGLTAPDLTAVPPTKQPGAAGGPAEDVRTVSMLVRGTLLVHGRRAPKTANVEASFHYTEGASPDARPAWIQIVTKAPMRITLADHDVKPRDTFGVLAKTSFSLLGTKVADVADVSLDLRANP